MTAEPLSAEWLQAVVASYGDFFTPPDADGAIVLIVLGAPEGDSSTTWTLKSGALSASDGADASAALTVTLAYKDFARALDGSLKPTVAYMQGLLKSAGDMRLMLDLLASAATPAFQSWRAGLATTSAR